ncbi:CotH kinase family protein [Akkermansiaceae bacterium]|nr:CotH kinase family protein [Akkermansiaceae bacterium]
MKKILSALTALYCGGLLSTRADLIVHWPLDASSGTTATDTSGNGLDGGWEGTSGPVSWQPAGGIDGGSVSFSGSNRDSFITSSFSEVSETPFTISTWVKTSSLSNEAAIYLGDGSTGNEYYIVRVQGGVGRANARNTSEVQCNGTTNIANGQWHHLVAVYSSPTDRKIYVDGVLEKTSTSNVSEMSLTRFGIGGLTRSTPYNPADLFDGELDDVALWDRDFSSEDVVAIRGLTLLGAGNAGDLESLMTAYDSQGAVEIRSQSWAYATNLTGSAGTTGGSVAVGNAFIVIDDSGNGMQIVGQTEPGIVSFTADHESISVGVPVTLNWQIFNADTVTLSGVGSVNSESGSVVVNPASTTTYTLTATNDEGSVVDNLTVTVSPATVDPSISEFLAKNDTGITDEDGAHSDWIEIHNDSAFALNLGGYFLTNDVLQLSKWSFPAMILGADERILVWASAKDRTGDPLHTNFTIDADGEYLALVRPNGTTIVQEFSPTFPAQSTDISYSETGFHSPPTPGEVNGGGALDGVLKKKVIFGTPGGLFFSGTVSLTLTHEDLEATIRYTTDGSEPDESSSLYSGAISITATTQIKARAFRVNFTAGPLAQEGYLFADSGLSTFDSDLPILVIDTFDTFIPRNDTTYREATFTAFDPSIVTGRSSLSDTPSEVGNSGIHTRGESSQLGGFNKLNFAFETRDSEGSDEDVALFGMPADSDWALHASEIDRTFIRERLPHYLFNEIGHYSARTRPIEVFLNQDGGPVSEDDYRGVYILVERIRRGNDRVDISKLDEDENAGPDVTGGYIFKKDKSDAGNVNISTPNEGNFAITYPIETDVTPAQRTYLQNYLRDFETALEGPNFADPDIGYAAYIDVESWIDFHVIQELTKEVDSYVFSTFYYKDRNEKIKCGPLWDFDRSFGNTSASDEDVPEGWRGGVIGGRGPFWERLFEDPNFMQRYVDRWQELMESNLNDTHISPIIAAMSSEVDEAKDRNFEPQGPWPLADVTRSHLDFPTYQEHVDYLEDWVSDRLAWVETQFTAKPQFVQFPGVYGGPFNLSLSGGAGTIYYTTDGSDPRASGGGISGAAYSGAIAISESTSVIARSRSGGEWSGPLQGSFIIGEPAAAGNFVITEIMYHPSPATAGEIGAGFSDEEAFEYLEFMNVGSNPIELADVVVSEAFDFTFGVQELAPGERILLVRDQAAFEFRFGAGHLIAGEYGIQKLGNGGERSVVKAADGSVIQDFTYGDKAPWPTAADGGGSSIVLIAPNGGLAGEAFGWVSRNPSPNASGGSSPFVGGDLLSYAISDSQGDGTNFSFEITPGAENVSYVVEVSQDLANWDSGPTFIDYLGETGATRSYRVIAPAGAKRFMRLRVNTVD